VVVLTSKDGAAVEIPQGLNKADLKVGAKDVFLPK
jgi:hypothetical protein